MVGEVVDGVTLQSGDVVSPLAKTLAMRFAWSLWICHQIGESLCQQAWLLSKSVPLRDRGPSTAIGLKSGVRFVRQYVHVDNLGTTGCSRDEVARVLREVTSISERDGLAVHDLKMSDGRTKPLRVVSD